MNYEHLRRVLDAQRELICEWAPDGAILFCNTAYRRYFGYGDDVVGQNLHDIIDWPEGDGPAYTLRGLSLGEPEVVTERSYGDDRFVEWTDSADFDEAGNVRSVVSVGRDITAKVTAERALAASEARHRTMTAYTLDSVALVTADLRLIDTTAKHRLDLGYAPSTWSNRTTFELLHPDDRGAALDRFAALVARGNGAEDYFEARMLRADGEYSTVEVDGVNLLDEPSVNAVVLVVRIIDRRKAIERELERRRDEAEAALRRRIAFVEQASHELRNPLHGMLGLSEALTKAHLPDDLADAAWGIFRQSSVMRRIVDDLLDVAQLEVGHLRVRPSVVDLQFAFNDCAFIARKTTADGVRLVVTDPATELRYSFADPDRVRQAIANLLSNACKYTSAGEIRLSASRGSVAGSVRISVDDNGPGLGMVDVDRLFEPYERGSDERSPGVGLGLTIVKGTVEAMGGSVGARSRREGGATFWFELPMAPAAVSSGAATPGDESASRGGLHALVVDDDPVNLMLARLQLAQLGTQVTAIDSGEAAWQLLQTAHYDVALIDVQMPGMSGLELVQRARDLVSPLPFLAVMTGSATAADRQAALGAGADMFVPKPATSADVGEVLRRAASRQDNWRLPGRG